MSPKMLTSRLTLFTETPIGNNYNHSYSAQLIT